MAKTKKAKKSQKENKSETIDDLEIATEVELDNELPGKAENKDEVKDAAGKSSEDVVISKQKAALMKNLLANIKDNNDKLIELMSIFVSPEELEQISIGQMSDEDFTGSEEDRGEGRIVEGVFDGENMIGPDGKQYSVPANYASKSKLVEGDILKLTITPNGTFVYKQIGPIDRARVIGKLEQTPNGNFHVISEDRKWKVLTASVTYFKGQASDEVVILVPKTGESKWAAVENIVKSPK